MQIIKEKIQIENYIESKNEDKAMEMMLYLKD